MKIGFSDSQKKFREEIREWLEKNVPKIPLNSFDTKEGFEEHRDWKKNSIQVIGRWLLGPNNTVAGV